MALTFEKATKRKTKLRAAVFGPSGAGKTFSCLRIATGIGGKIAVIDTERGSASKYSDRFEFDVLELPRKDIDTYVEGIRTAGEAGYAVLVIDSLSHAWQELLTEVDAIAKAKFRGNTWSAWSEGTPKQRRLVEAILEFPGHVMVTMRSRTEWAQEQDDRGKIKPVRVGVAPVQGKGIEYEFDLLFELSVDHVCNVIKDRSGRFQDRIVEKPDEAFGKELVAWLEDGAEPTPRPTASEDQRARAYDAISKAQERAIARGIEATTVVERVAIMYGNRGLDEVPIEDLREIYKSIEDMQPEEQDTRTRAERIAAGEAVDA